MCGSVILLHCVMIRYKQVQSCLRDDNDLEERSEPCFRIWDLWFSWCWKFLVWLCGWLVVLCSLEGGYKHLAGMYCRHRLFWRWRQYVFLKLCDHQDFDVVLSWHPGIIVDAIHVQSTASESQLLWWTAWRPSTLRAPWEMSTYSELATQNMNHPPVCLFRILVCYFNTLTNDFSFHA